MMRKGLSRSTRKALLRDGFSREIISTFERAGLADEDFTFHPELGAMIRTPAVQKLGRFVGTDRARYVAEWAARFQRKGLRVVKDGAARACGRTPEP
jgi:hypothetical protein